MGTIDIHPFKPSGDLLAAERQVTDKNIRCGISHTQAPLLRIFRKFSILLQLGIASLLQTKTDFDAFILASISDSGSRRKYKEEAFEIRMRPS